MAIENPPFMVDLPSYKAPFVVDFRATLPPLMTPKGTVNPMVKVHLSNGD
jgi:hypothetical protein